MPNKNYLKGKAKEQRLKKKHQGQGFLVIRAAGSKGFADLVCIKGDLVKFVQVKPKNFNKKEKARLEKQFSWINKNIRCSFSVE